MKLPYLCTILMLILLNACVAPKRVKAAVPAEWQKDAAPDGCETAQDWGTEPYDIEKPCKHRSTGKI